MRNDAVSLGEMLESACGRTCARVSGRHVLAIQDTTTVRAEDGGRCVALHPVIAVDAVDGGLLGLVEAQFFTRTGGKRSQCQNVPFADKESRRWLDGAKAAGALKAAGAACVTVVADREGDIYEDFALRPEGTELVIRAGQDRRLTDGTRLFDRLANTHEMGRMSVELAAAPGRKARTAIIGLRFASVEVASPVSRKSMNERKALPPSVLLTLIEAREVDPPLGAPDISWRLLTSHRVTDLADARRIVGFYRRRWIIEEVFRALKTKGFDVERLRLAQGPFEKLVLASLIAAVTVLQLVHERDGARQSPVTDAFDEDDIPALEATCTSLEGKTLRQKNPHPKRSLAYAAWVLARLGGWTGYYGKPGSITMLHGLVQFHAIKHGWSLRLV
ncbi:MAG: IS4 family transposase [Beijerinckiaceae bacterium]